MFKVGVTFSGSFKNTRKINHLWNPKILGESEGMKVFWCGGCEEMEVIYACIYKVGDG